MAFQARQVLLLAFAGLVVGVVLGGVARRLARHLSWPKPTHRYAVSLWIVTLAAFAFMAVGVYFIGPRVVNDIKQLDAELPDAIKTVKEFPPVQAYLSNGENGLSSEQMDTVTNAVSSTVQTLLSGTLFMVTSLVLIAFVAIFSAAQPALYRSATCSFFPKSRRDECDRAVRACVESLWDWLKGQGLAMLLVGALSTVGLLLIDVRYALTLGILAGLFQFVPYLGPIISAVPALLVAITMSPQTALWVALLYLGIQFIEGNFITPMVMKREADLPPLATLLSTVLFAAVFGVIGAVVATPLAVVLLALKQEIYDEHVIG